MPAPASRALVPGVLRRSLDAARFLRASGLLARPGLLVARLRARRTMATLDRLLLEHRGALALLLAHEVGVFDALERRPLTAQGLAAERGLRPRAAEALLRILESEALVERHGERYRLPEGSRTLLVRGGELSVAPLLELMSAQVAAFTDVVRGLRTGEVPPSLDIFSPGARSAAFLDAVNEHLYWAAADLLARVSLPPVHSAIVGSMGVGFSARLLERAPGARITYGCLEHLIREVPRLRRRYGVPDDAVAGEHAHGGDPLADRWGDEDFDLVMLTKKMVLRPEDRVGESFARKAFQVLRPGGVAIFWESVHPVDGPTPPMRAMEALMDLVASPDGRVNVEDELARLLERIGYQDVQVVACLGDRTTFVVARKG
ncbi:MAG: hypothetical protein IT376_00440 [Polyangiaceae bacterium]|nr:hypothetical protein [Polyangiaceae bacterium]